MAVLGKQEGGKYLTQNMLFAVTVYLLLATTVHPWYLALPLVLCLFTRYRYPVLWTLVIFFTYINYSYDPYWENLWVVAVEYLIVLTFLLVEVQRRPLAER